MNEFKVGLLALATMAIIVYMSLTVTSNQSGFGKYVTYKTVMDDASGIFPKTSIKVAGINAGKIKDIELKKNKAHITFEVLQEVVLTPGSVLKVKTVGMLGDKFLEIDLGESSEERLAEDSLIPTEDSGNLDSLVKQASEVVTDVKDIVRTLKSSVVPEDGKEPALKIILENARQASQSIKDLLANNNQKIDDIVSNLEHFTNEIAYQADQQYKDSAMSELKMVLANTKSMTADLQKLVADIKSGKGTVGRLLVEEQIADEVQTTLASVRKLMGRVDAIRSEISVYTGVNSDYGGETVANLRLSTSPERFYIFGVTTSEFGFERVQHISTNIDGTESKMVRREKRQNGYRFNLQIGRRIHNWSFRGGVIETTGGLGVDYDSAALKTRLSLEVFDYRSDIGANFRLSSQTQIWNVVYGRLAIEDLLVEQSRSFTVSAGLNFDEEDLKGLIGLFF